MNIDFRLNFLSHQLDHFPMKSVQNAPVFPQMKTLATTRNSIQSFTQNAFRIFNKTERNTFIKTVKLLILII